MFRTRGTAAWIAIAVPAFFLLAAADLGLRSRGALARGEQHARWRDYPAEKAAHFNSLFALRAAEITAEAAAGRLAPEQAARAEALAAAERDLQLVESSAKQAWLWYRTAAREFRSPLNPWAARAEKELPAALAAWRAELRSRGVKTEDWMLE
ncbi:MAG: hypothetical protein A2X32_03050 [Elusimicrobia bacterium GWC2_64_44]|nr:MAG: hypothetical protein A2X32_03050 [Elusimicrobia bacterium GWC2_64_44]